MRFTFNFNLIVLQSLLFGQNPWSTRHRFHVLPKFGHFNCIYTWHILHLHHIFILFHRHDIDIFGWNLVCAIHATISFA